MGTPPAKPAIYYITHVDILQSIVGCGGILCASTMRARGVSNVCIGNVEIERRRQNLPVHCHPGNMVDDYVPFYFCPRTPMLYVISRANHPALEYHGGQTPIVHLVSDMHAVIGWATGAEIRWAFSSGNAGAKSTLFWADVAELHRIDWRSVNAKDWSNPDVKEAKMAEFLVHGMLPWNLVSRIGVQTPEIGRRVKNAVGAGSHRPVIEVRSEWYY